MVSATPPATDVKKPYSSLEVGVMVVNGNST
jgi:hypothetical protein